MILRAVATTTVFAVLLAGCASDGSGGDDLFVFDNGDGDDTIEGFQAGAGSDDVIDLSDFGFADTAAVLAATTDIGGNAVIQLDLDDSLTLIGVLKSELHGDDFLV